MIHLPVAVADSVENQGLDLVEVVGILAKHPENTARLDWPESGING